MLHHDRAARTGSLSCWALLVLGLALLVGPTVCPVQAKNARPTRMDQLDEGLKRNVPDMLKYIRKHYKSVGVLKFRVKLGNVPSTFRAGQLNSSMAHRLENALLASSPPKDKLLILNNPTAVALKQSRQSEYVTARGRKKLFSYKYPLKWKAEPVSPDVFLTGNVLVGSRFVKNKKGKTERILDWRYTTVDIEGFDKSAPERPFLLARYEVKTDRVILVESGRGFRLSKGAFKHGLPPDSIALGTPGDMGLPPSTGSGKPKPPKPTTPPTPVKPEPRPRPTPVVLDDSQVDVKIFYDNTTADTKPLDSAKALRATMFHVDVPSKGTKIKIRVTNKGKEKIGAVVTVNGRNTLYREDEKDLQFTDKTAMSRWIIDPGKSVTIEGFYLEGDKEVQPFKVVSLESFHKNYSAFSSMVADLRGTINVHILKTGAAGQEPIVLNGFRSAAPDTLVVASSRSLARKQIIKLTGKGLIGKGRNIIAGADDVKEAKLSDDTLPNPVHYETKTYSYFRVPLDRRVKE